MDALSRQLAKAETDAEDMVREREVLLEEMRASQQVRVDIGLGGGGYSSLSAIPQILTIIHFSHYAPLSCFSRSV